MRAGGSLPAGGPWRAGGPLTGLCVLLVGLGVPLAVLRRAWV
jgi:hypothetical protein